MLVKLLTKEIEKKSDFKAFSDHIHKYKRHKQLQNNILVVALLVVKM